MIIHKLENSTLIRVMRQFDGVLAQFHNCGGVKLLEKNCILCFCYQSRFGIVELREGVGI